MPEFLFDIADIDLGAVAVSPERVGELNPQCGHMRQIDHLVWMSDDRSAGIGLKRVRDDEFWVPCHIPGRPLLPGVLMIEAAAQTSSVLYKCKAGEMRFLGFTRCDDVAFRGQVVPGDDLYLLAKEVSFRPRKFTCAAQGIVRGSVVFEALITGMVL